MVCVESVPDAVFRIPKRFFVRLMREHTFVHDPNHKGNVAEAAIAAAAIKLGVDVVKPLVEHTRYDLIFDLRPQLLRVQCKWAPLKGDVIVVRLAGSRYTSGGRQIRTTYSAAEVDAVAVYCEELDRCYLLLASLFDGMRGLHLRVATPRNGQRASLNWAQDYEMSGAVAQLGRASEWHSEGRGFESHQLHSSHDGAGSEVGAHEFRNHFGWYMERAAAGEQILVTRRGKPSVRLVPADAAVTQLAARFGGVD
jgi:prevent-host-death family protein